MDGRWRAWSRRVTWLDHLEGWTRLCRGAGLNWRKCGADLSWAGWWELYSKTMTPTRPRGQKGGREGGTPGKRGSPPGSNISQRKASLLDWAEVIVLVQLWKRNLLGEIYVEISLQFPLLTAGDIRRSCHPLFLFTDFLWWNHLKIPSLIWVEMAQTSAVCTVSFPISQE